MVNVYDELQDGSPFCRLGLIFWVSMDWLGYGVVWLVYRGTW